MAFNADGLQVIGEIGSVGTGAGSIKRKFGYSTNDTKTVVETNGYFDEHAAKLNTGDIIEVSGDLDGTPWTRSYVCVVTTGDVALTAAAVA